MAPYRVLVQFDPEKKVFVARAPELEHCSAEGATRAEAIAKVEEEIAAQLDIMKERGGQAPVPVDDAGAEWSGEISAKVSRTLHRELAFQAKAEGIDLGQLLSEMLPHALVERRRERRRSAQPGAPEQGDRGERFERGGERDRDRDRRGGRGQGGRYYAIMEDKATFLEYVRGLDSGGGQRPPRDDRRGGGGRRGGRGSGGGSGSGPGSDEDGNA